MSDRAGSVWIESPRWDGLWMFSGLWAPLLAIVAYLLADGSGTQSSLTSFGASVQGIAFIYLPLSVLHRITTTYAVLGTPIMRDDVRKNPARYLYVPAAILAASILLSLAFAFHGVFAFMPSAHAQLWAFFLLAYVMFGWDRWHFCAQEFGVLSIYRVRAGQTAPEDKRFDRGFTVVLMLVVNTVLVFRAGFGDLRQVVLYGTSLSEYRGDLLEPVAMAAFALGAVFTGYALVREWRHSKRSAPKLGFYVLVGGHSLALYFFPSSLGLFFLSYAFHHWMVSVGLFGRITLHAYEAHPQPAGARPRPPFARLFFGVAPYLALALVLYLTCQDLDRAGNLSPVPDLRMFSGASTAAKVLVGVIMGLFFALNYLHYYYDRCFYAFSSPAVRKTVAPLLFRQKTARSAEPVMSAVASPVQRSGV